LHDATDIFEPQKARRVLPATVRGELGLGEGEVWFVSRDTVTFWAIEKLTVGKRYEMRVDTEVTGRNVDIFVKVRRMMDGRDARQARGFVYRGRFETEDVQDRKRLMLRFWQLNPELRPASQKNQAAEDRAGSKSAAERPRPVREAAPAPRRRKRPEQRRRRAERRRPAPAAARRTPVAKKAPAETQPAPAPPERAPPVVSTWWRPEKPRRPLPLTVLHQARHHRGELWLADDRDVSFWVATALDQLERCQMRVGMGPKMRGIELSVQVRDTVERQAGIPSAGSVHRGSYTCGVEGGASRIIRRLIKLNPELRGSFAGPGTKAAAGRRSAAAPRRSAPKRPARKASARGSGRPAGIRPPVADAERLVPELAPGQPPVVMLRYLDRERLRADALLNGNEFWLFVAAHGGFSQGMSLRLLVQLPRGHFIQLNGKVEECVFEHTALCVRNLAASELAVLRMALE